jgi:Uma2 family endonuclease
MVAQPSQPKFMSIEEFRTLERANPDVKYEYIDGQAYVMSGGNADHARISSNMVRALEDVLGDRPCLVYNSDLHARIGLSRLTLPDVTVTCDERDVGKVTEIRAPRVIVEVLSPSTEAYNRGRKFGYYRACPTIQEYVLVVTDYQAVEVYRRTAKGWTEYQVYGPGDEVELTSINVRFPLAVLYRRTTVPETLDAPEGEV